MAKMVPIMGREATEKLFLKRFAELCSNPMFTIRKICASSFGEFCAVVGPEAYETVLVSLTFYFFFHIDQLLVQTDLTIIKRVLFRFF